MTDVVTPQPAAQPARAWQDETRPLPERVELLLAAMTLEEKVGQLGSRWVGNNLAGEPGVEETELQVAPMQEVFAASGTVPLAEASRHGLGHLTRVYGSEPVSVAEGADELVRQQRIVMESSRFDVPALVHEECLTGFTAYGATVYPAAIAWGATWDPDLVRRMAATIGRDMAALGVHQGLSPVLDVVRDYRWGRVEETLGEDPFLVASLGTAYVQGLQSAGVIATLKHFAGYSASRAARNHGPVSMGPRELRDVILPSFEMAVALGGVGSVMNSYADVDGVPAGANSWLLTELLREEWGFEGTVVSDYWAVPFLASMHRVAADACRGRRAGPRGRHRRGAARHPRVRRRTGRAGPRRLARRVVRGPRCPPGTPRQGAARPARRRVDPRGVGRTTPAGSTSTHRQPGARARDGRALRRPARRRHGAADQERAASGAEQGGGRRPCADDARTFMGCYSFPMHVLPRHPRAGLGIECPTALDALRAELERRRGGARARLRRPG